MADEGSSSNNSHRSQVKKQEKCKKQAAGAAAALAAVAVATSSHLFKEPMYNSSFTGELRMQELLHAHDKRFYNSFGMKKDVFFHLKLDLQEYANFANTKYMTMDEQLGIFLHICCSGNTTCDIQEQFQRSPDTVHR